MVEIKKEVVKSSQNANAEELFNRTVSKLNLTTAPEEVSEIISNLTEEFIEAKAKEDVMKVKEVLIEMKSKIAHVKEEIKSKGKEKGSE